MVDGVRTEELSRKAQRSARGSEVEWLARIGLVAQGISYVIVAILALLVAVGEKNKPEDRTGALEQIASESFGKPLLIVLAFGFAAYAIWRLAEAFFDRGGEGDDAKGLAKRAASFGKALIYIGLCYVTVKILLGSGSSGNSEKKATSTILDWPAGRWLVGAAGVAIVGAGLYNAYRAVTADFAEDLEHAEMSAAEERWYRRIGRLGYAARAVVFTLIGVFVTKAAIEYDPSETIGLDGALAKLAGQPYGPFLLGVTAAGLLCYGLFSFVQARYRRV
jgi:Domain of Unknown Function (DUF1206)